MDILNSKRAQLDRAKKMSYKITNKTATKTPDDVEKELTLPQKYDYKIIQENYRHIRKGVL